MIQRIGKPYPRIELLHTRGNAKLRVSPNDDGEYMGFEFEPTDTGLTLTEDQLNKMMIYCYQRGMAQALFQARQKFDKVFRLDYEE